MVTVIPVEGILPPGVCVQAVRYRDGVVVVAVEPAAFATAKEEERAVAAAAAALGG